LAGRRRLDARLFRGHPLLGKAACPARPASVVNPGEFRALGDMEPLASAPPGPNRAERGSGGTVPRSVVPVEAVFSAVKHAQFDGRKGHVVQTVRIALAALPSGDTFEIKALMYLQGASNSGAEAARAGQRLIELTANLQRDLRRAEPMRVLVGGVAAKGIFRHHLY